MSYYCELFPIFVETKPIYNEDNFYQGERLRYR